MQFTTILGSLAFAAALPAATQAGAEAAMARPADFKSEADALLNAFPADGPGAAAIVTRRGQTIYASGRGLADVEARRPITPDTPFRLGSIVKQFTAALVLQLAAEGKLSLDDPLSKFYPDWPKPGAGATVRQLLNHSSGLQDFSKIPGWIVKNRHRAWTTEELVAVMRELSARSEPGRAWEYNNGGYVMLGAIIEKVEGKAWHEALAERITRPLGLRTIANAAPGDVNPATARGYTEEDGRQQPVQLSHMSIAHAAGGLNGSVSDMARWAHALHHCQVVKPELYQEMVRPARLADGSNRPYGFGLRLQEFRGRKALVHGGAGGGLDTASIYVPADEIFVAVFANSDDPATDPDTLAHRLAALALGEPIEAFESVPVDTAAVEPLFGVYGAKGGPPRRFFSRGGKLYLGRGDDEMEAFAAGDDRFFFGRDELTWFRILRKADGAHVMEVHRPEATAPVQAVRTGPVPAAFALPEAVLRSYVGTYATEGPVLTVALGANGGLTIGPAGQSPTPLRPVSETEFRVEGTPMRLVFHPENGQVNRLTLHRGARELHGKRVSR